MQTTIQHDPATQRIIAEASTDMFERRDSGYGQLIPIALYYGIDSPEQDMLYVRGDQVHGPFYTRGACDFVLGCIYNVRVGH